METLIIYGCGGHARSVASVVKSTWNIIFVDPGARKGEKIFGFDVLPDWRSISNLENCFFHVAIGDGEKRKKVFEMLKSRKFRLPVLCASSAIIGSESIVGEGSFIAEGVYIGPRVSIGMNNIINTRALIEHDAMVLDHTHISINTAIAGYSRVGSAVMLGASSTVIDHISICDNVTIGAGAVVCHDITAAGIYAGVPAVKIKDISHEKI